MQMFFGLDTFKVELKDSVLAQALKKGIERLTQLPLDEMTVRLTSLIDKKTFFRSRRSKLSLDSSFEVLILNADNQEMYKQNHPLLDLLPADYIPHDSLIIISTDPDPLEKEAARVRRPNIEGEFTLNTTNSWQNNLKITRLEEDHYPRRSLSAFMAAAPEQEPLISILIHQDIYRNLVKTRMFSNHYEEGGFFIGMVYANENRPNGFIIEIRDAINAEHFGASFSHLNFTGESFAQVKKLIREQRPEEKILGWYHTHLFSADALDIGLSRVDLQLHNTTFLNIWQVAGLINFENDGSRLLRFYVRTDGQRDMYEQQYWVI
ncbi:MAG: hypothetical protein IT260_00885 [Saprospiraceae bacterium]|nr:hypothetical protein [Saprospiraceae bacterium]